MNKYQFMKILNASLDRLPIDEQREIIQDFEEHFEAGLEEGKSEEEIVAALGSPHQIAKELVATYHLEKVEQTKSTGNILRAVWAVIGLGFFNLVIVLGPFIAVAALILAGWIVGISFTLSPFLVLVNVVIFPKTFILFDLFFSILLSGIGLFLFIGMFYTTRLVTNWFVRYLNFNVKLVKGGVK